MTIPVSPAVSFLRALLTVPCDPSVQNLADSLGNPQGLCLLVEGIHTEIWIVSETGIHMEIPEKILIRD